MRERAEVISRRYNKKINAATLWRYYRKAGITFKTVDLFCTNKLKRKEEILGLQQDFVYRLKEA